MEAEGRVRGTSGAHEFVEVVGVGMELEADGVGDKRTTCFATARPLDLACLDGRCCGAVSEYGVYSTHVLLSFLACDRGSWLDQLGSG